MSFIYFFDENGEIIEMNGAIEPLAIRSAISAPLERNGTFKEHKILGHLQEGNENPLDGRTDRISQFYDIRVTGSQYFDDRADVKLNFTSSYVECNFSSKQNVIVPFDDSSFRTKAGTFLSGANYNAPSSSFDITLKDRLLHMTGSSTDNYMPEPFMKSGHTGFVYDGTKFNIDSLAFGGLKY